MNLIFGSQQKHKKKINFYNLHSDIKHEGTSWNAYMITISWHEYSIAGAEDLFENPKLEVWELINKTKN